jgi:hypothetical protein
LHVAKAQDIPAHSKENRGKVNPAAVRVAEMK